MSYFGENSDLKNQEKKLGWEEVTDKLSDKIMIDGEITVTISIVSIVEDKPIQFYLEFWE